MRRPWIVTTSLLFCLLANGFAAAQPASPGPAADARFHDMAPDRRERIAERRSRFEGATPEERQLLRERRLWRMRRFSRGPAHGVDAVLHQLSRADRLALREQVRSLPEGERRELRAKFRRFDSLPETERTELRDRFAMLQSLDSGERQQVQRNALRFREMEAGERRRLRSAMARFRELPPDEQQEWLDRALAETPEQTR